MWPAVLLTLGLSGAADPDAKELLTQARDRLAKARVLDVKFDGVVDIDGKRDGKLAGRFQLSIPDQKLHAELLNDPVKGRKNAPYSKSQSGQGVPKSAEKVLDAVGRAGAFVPFFVLENWDDVKVHGLFLDDPSQLDESKPKLGTKKRIGEREAQAVEFTLTSKNEKLTISNVVWIDVRRRVPLKWSGTVSRGKITIAFEESYDKVEIGK